MSSDDRLVMHHTWSELSFLHWKVDRDALQSLLPPGLTIDTFEDEAYIGLVPFTMSGIRLERAPLLPGLHRSHETNVRTYVVDEQGRRGVWFFSLDAENLAFVRVARAWYRLPYYRARMDLQADQNAVSYGSYRSREVGICRVEVEKSGVPTLAQPGSLDYFLVERYNLFAYSRGRLLIGRVEHMPYLLLPAKTKNVSEDLTKLAQIARLDEEPLTHFSPGVMVRVYGVRRA